MSKIGRKPIVFSSAKVEVKGNKILVGNGKLQGEYILPEEIVANLDGKTLTLTVRDGVAPKSVYAKWGMHRALLANKIAGIEKSFEQAVKIVGLGYKAQLSGKKLVLSLGYSHKVEYQMPEGVTVDIDKTGQNLVFKSHDKFLLGSACDEIKRFRRPEPYKGTGIMRVGERIIRKVGKTGV